MNSFGRAGKQLAQVSDAPPTMSDLWCDDDDDHAQQLAREARSREATFHNVGAWPIAAPHMAHKMPHDECMT